jgi:hypothetical protein
VAGTAANVASRREVFLMIEPDQHDSTGINRGVQVIVTLETWIELGICCNGRRDDGQSGLIVGPLAPPDDSQHRYDPADDEDPCPTHNPSLAWQGQGTVGFLPPKGGVGADR